MREFSHDPTEYIKGIQQILILDKNRLDILKRVPQPEYENLKDAPSLGSYLHRNYKNIYPYERIG